MKFSVIIVSWNGESLLKEYLPSICSSDHKSFEVIVADNASTDGTSSLLLGKYPQVKHVKLEENFGYAGGNNRAVPEAKGEYLIFLNNDVRVPSEWLLKLEEFLDQNPVYSIVQPKIMSLKDKYSFDYAGAAGGFIDWLGYPFCQGRIVNTIEKDNEQFEQPKQIFWASGAAFLIKKSVFESLGGFDEDFEFHMEEIDLCWRANIQGYNVGYCPNTAVYHLGGGSLDRADARKLYYNFRNTLYMLYKNLPSKRLRVTLFLRMLMDGLSFLTYALTFKFKAASSILKAHLDYYAHLETLRAKRMANPGIENSRILPNLILNKSLIWLYFVRGYKMYSQIPKNS